jgi:hypothetical protein
LAKFCSVIWPSFVRPFGQVLFGHSAKFCSAIRPNNSQIYSGSFSAKIPETPGPHWTAEPARGSAIGREAAGDTGKKFVKVGVNISTRTRTLDSWQIA